MILVVGGALLGVMAGLSGNAFLATMAESIAHIFKNLLEMVSIPVIFLSITATITGMRNKSDIKHIGLRVLRYTVVTTLVAAGVGLLLFLLINPSGAGLAAQNAPSAASLASHGYLSFFLSIVPSNVIDAFSSGGSVTSVVFFALILSAAILTLPDEERFLLHRGFSALFNALLAVTQFILALMPLGVWAFVTQFVLSLQSDQTSLVGIGWYIAVVLGANLLQAFVVLPLFLFIKGIDPFKMFAAFRPALAVAFFSKSSNATLPLTIKCARDNAGITPEVADFTLPLCATINMNGCAAFILITVLFVGTSHGMVFTIPDMIAWIVLATIAAVGNAGVPMGCFFLTSAFLVHLHVPLTMMGVILPIYTLIDMVETAVNVWSDSCVATVVDKDLADIRERSVKGQ